MIRAVFILLLLASGGQAQTITGVQLIEPTARYGHHPMGPTVADHGAMRLELNTGMVRVLRLPETRVFEDNAARLVDVSGDGQPEIVVVEADDQRGARLSLYGIDGLIAASPFIGRRNRWMAVAAVADLDGDGRVEIAAVDRPHLRKTLVIWQLAGDQLIAVAELPGVTNHQWGAAQIAGGLRDCSTGPEVIVADADWTGLMAVRFHQGALSARDLGHGAGPTRFQQAMRCAD